MSKEIKIKPQQEENEKDNDLVNLAHQDKQADIDLKKMYGKVILIVLSAWVAFVIAFSIVLVCRGYEVSDLVFIVLLTTTTANMLALPAIVLKYLFPHKNQLNK